MSRSSASPFTRWPLPAQDDWSTPFAELLLAQLDLHPGLTILDIALHHGIPAFIWPNTWGRPAPSSGST